MGSASVSFHTLHQPKNGRLNQRSQDLITKVDRDRTAYVIANLLTRLLDLPLATYYLRKPRLKHKDQCKKWRTISSRQAVGHSKICESLRANLIPVNEAQKHWCIVRHLHVFYVC